MNRYLGDRCVVGLYDKASDKVTYAGIYDSYFVGCREIFRLCAKDLVWSKVVDDYEVVCLSDDGTITPFRDLCVRYGVDVVDG